MVVAAPPQSKRGDDADGQDVDEAQTHKNSRSHRRPSAVRTPLLAGTDEVLGKDKQRDGSAPVPIGQVRWRDRATVEGRVRAVHAGPVSGTLSLQCELVDDSGGVKVVFMGRRSIPGIGPGTGMRVTGTIGHAEGHLAIFNPVYTLLPREAHL